MFTGRSSAFFIAAFLLPVCSTFSTFDQDPEEDGIEEDDGDEFAAMQTQVTLLGRVGGADRLEDDSDSASFIQSQAETISKNDRSCSSSFQIADELDDALSLIQTDAAKHSPKETSEQTDDDKFSFIQAEITGAAAAEKVKVVDRSKILAWDTILAMDVNTEEDEVKKMGKILQKETSVARALTNEISDVNMLLVEPDEAPANAAASRSKCQNCDESTSLMQENVRTEKRSKKKATKKAKKSIELVGDETSFMQTTITLSKGARRVGVQASDDGDEDDLTTDDGIAFMQADVKLEHGCSRQREYMEEEEDEDDIFTL
jgi:hypothetical protein